MSRTTLLSACLLCLVACGEADDKSDDTADSAPPVVERDGTYSGTMDLVMTGGGGEGDCQLELELTVADDAVAGSACCSVEGLSSHGDVDICFDIDGALGDGNFADGDIVAYEQGEVPGDPNGSWTGGFDAEDDLVGSGDGAMDHDMGSSSFELLYDLSFDLTLQ